MGCLKLTYYQTYSNRKVLYSDCVLEPKSAQMWLSVDPMSDKYPSMSPYNYCANNPVILVDPDGREWLNTFDELFSKLLIEKADLQIMRLEKWTKRYDKKIKKLKEKNADPKEIEKYENYKKEVETDIGLLKEGIETLNYCGSKDNPQKYTFSELKNQTCHVLKDNKTGVITFQYDGTTSTAWHEVQHYTDFLKKRFSISFEDTRKSTDYKLLKSNESREAENNANKSEKAFIGF